MSFNAAQEARRQLKPKSRRPGMAARGSSPNLAATGADVPLFLQPDGGVSSNMPATESFTMPSTQTFAFGGGAFQPTGVNNPFSGGSSQFGQSSNMNGGAEMRNAGGEEDMSRKKPFGGFSTTTSSQPTSTSNIFGGQPAAPMQASNSLFSAPSTSSIFGNNGANSPTTPFTFAGSSTQAQAPNSSNSIFANVPTPKPASNSFTFGQTQPQPSEKKNPLFGGGASFSFPPPTSTGNSPAPSPSASTSFTFGQTQTSAVSQTPALSASSSFPPNNATSIFANSAAPATGSSLFSSATKTPATSQPKFGGQADNMFNIAPSKPPSQSLFASTSQTTSSTPAVSSTPSTSLFSGFGSSAAPTKPASDSSSATTSGEQSPKAFTFGGSSKTQENDTPQTSSTQSIFGNLAQKPATSNLFGTPTTAKAPTASDSSSPFQFGKSTESVPASKSQSTSDGSNLFQFLKPAESAASSTPTQQINGTNALPAFNFTPHKMGSYKDDSNKTTSLFSQPQPSRTPSQPEKTSNDGPATTAFTFSQPQPSQTSQASQPEKPNNDGSAKPTFTFGQSQPSQTSQTFSNNLFGNLKPAENQTESNSDPKPSSSNNNGTPAAKDSGSSLSKPNSLFGNPFDSSKAAASFAQKHKPVKPSPLSQSMTGSGSPDADRSANSSIFQSASQTNSDNNTYGLSSILGSPSKPSQQAAQQTHEEKKEYDASQRLRSLAQAVKASIARMPVTADLSELLVFYNTRREEILKDFSKTKRKAVDEGVDEDGSGPGPLKRQRQNNGKAAATSTPKFVSSGGSFKENEAVETAPLKSPTKAPPRPAFQSPLKQAPLINGSTTPRGPPPTNIFAAQALMTPTPVVSKPLPQTEKPKTTTSIFSAGTSTVPRNPTAKTTFEFGVQAVQLQAPKTNATSRDSSPPKQAASSSRSLSNLFGSSNQSSVPSSTTQSAKQPAQLNLFAPSSKQASTASTSPSSQQPTFSAPSGLSFIPESSPASGGKRKAESQITKDDFEAEESRVSTPGGKRKATSQLTKDDSETSEKAPSTPSGKRKAEVQLTKDDSESENGLNDSTVKTPKINGTGSETSKLFKNILDSPRQTNGTGQASPQKKMFSLNKSDDSTPRPNPFASLGVAKSPTPAASQTPAKAFATPGASFGSSVTQKNDASKSLFSVPKSGSSNSASIFSAPNLAQKDSSPTASTQPTLTNGFSFGSTQKPAASPSMPSSSGTGLKVPSFGAISNGASAAEQFKKDAEKATEAAALKKAIDAEYDSDEDGDKAEWIKNWKEERARKAKELSKQSKPVFIPGKGFSFSSQDEDPKVDSKEDSLEPEDSPKSPLKSPSEPPSEPPSEQPITSSIDVSRDTSLGPATSASGSVLNGQIPLKAFPTSANIFAKFANVSDKGNEADDESTDEGSEAELHDDEKKDPTYDPAAEPEIETPDSPVEETGPGIASAKKLTSTSALSQPPTSGASTPKGSLFDRIVRDSDGNPVRQISTENKENTQPSSPFSFLSNAPSNQTWNQNTPIKFGTSAAASTAPSINFTSATPPASKPFEFSASTKAPATVSGLAPAPLSNIFGASTATTTQPKPFGNLFGSAAASSSGSETSAPTPGSSIFGTTKTQSVFSGLGDSKPATVGFSFGGASTPAASSLFPSAAASIATSRATTPGATTDNDSNAATETSGDPDAERHEQINLTDSRAGEEDEEVLFESRAKVFIWETKDWASRGVGPLRVLKHKETGATRTLLRADPSANIVLNKGLLGSINYESDRKTVKLITASDDGKGLERWLLQVKTLELATDLAKVLEESKPKST